MRISDWSSDVCSSDLAVSYGERAGRFAGIEGRGRLADWTALRRQKDELVGTLRQSKYIDLLPAYNGIAYLEGQAQLHRGAVSLNGQRLEAGKLFIATACNHPVPSIPGFGRVPYRPPPPPLQ